MKGKGVEPTDSVGKVKFKEYDITIMSLIMDSIRDHLIPYIAKLETSKEMNDSLTSLFTVNNIGQVMSLKNDLHDVRMKNHETVASYFLRISRLGDRLQVIDHVIYEKDIFTTTLNGLPRSWNAFVDDISRSKEVTSFEEL